MLEVIPSLRCLSSPKAPWPYQNLFVYSIPSVSRQTWHPVITFCPSGNTLRQNHHPDLSGTVRRIFRIYGSLMEKHPDHNKLCKNHLGDCAEVAPLTIIWMTGFSLGITMAVSPTYAGQVEPYQHVPAYPTCTIAL